MPEQPILSHAISAPESIDVDSNRYERFLHEVYARRDTKFIVISFAIASNDLMQWLHVNKPSFSCSYYWQNASGSHTMAALGKTVELNTCGSDRFNSMSDKFKELNKHTLHFNTATEKKVGFTLVGAFSFFDNVNSTLWKAFPPASLILPKYVLHKFHNQYIASVAISVENISTIEALNTSIKKSLNFFPTEDGASSRANNKDGGSGNFHAKNEAQQARWHKMVKLAKREIAADKLEKVVLSRQMSLPTTMDHDFIFQQLQNSFPKCYSFMLQKEGGGTFLGSTPELLLSVDGKHVKTEALAGSMARGSNKQEDERMETMLQNSKKDQREHRYVVDGVKKGLASFVQDISCSDHPRTKKMANVQHLHTPIKATLKDPSTSLELLGRLHPTPAVGGTPRESSLSFIRQHEGFKRGLFAGPVGWISSNGDAEFAVAIRSGLIKNRRAHLFAGCGIVADSDPRAEWQESKLKFRPLLSALNYE